MGKDMDVSELVKSVRNPVQVAARLALIKQLVEQGHLFLDEDATTELIDHCQEICHKHGIELELTAIYEGDSNEKVHNKR